MREGTKGSSLSLIITVAARSVFIFVPAIKRQALLAFQSRDGKTCPATLRELSVTFTSSFTTQGSHTHTQTATHKIYANLSRCCAKGSARVLVLLITRPKPGHSVTLHGLLIFLCTHTQMTSLDQTQKVLMSVTIFIKRQKHYASVQQSFFVKSIAGQRHTTTMDHLSSESCKHPINTSSVSAKTCKGGLSATNV